MLRWSCVPLRDSDKAHWRCARQKALIFVQSSSKHEADCVWNVMAHAQKPDFVFQRNGRVYLNRKGRQFSRLLAAEVCASAVVMLETTCSEVVWRVLATHSIHQFPLHFPSRASPCTITFQLDSTLRADGPWLPYLRYLTRYGLSSTPGDQVNTNSKEVAWRFYGG